jgi:transcriptional regulator with PAS, ATPase and Fis domain
MVVVRGPDGTPIAGVEIIRDRREVEALETALRDRRSLHGIIGRSSPMQDLYDLVIQVSPYDLPILITGESGVGKERFADAIQALSDRSTKPYVKINCAALSPTLVESELFGHSRGAFTGASSDRGGCFEEANTGTLLLDEVGELSKELQAKLLRAIQNGEIQRVGEDQRRKMDVRVLATTNRDIGHSVESGDFREDLFYRLAGAHLHVPPLRERSGDIPLLAQTFLQHFSERSEVRGRPKPVPVLSDPALDDLVRRRWRGNVRELENVLQLAFIRVPRGQLIEIEHLQTPGGVQNPEESLNLRKLETRTIQRALERSNGNLSRAARLLGIDRTTLWRRLRRAEIGSGDPTV